MPDSVEHQTGQEPDTPARAAQGALPGADAAPGRTEARLAPASPQAPADPPPAPPAAAADEPAPRAPRMRVLKGATAAFNHEFSAIPCQLREVSETGARLIFEGGWFVPDRFTLHVALDGYKVECERVWQRGSECGVRFLGERQVIGKPRQQVLTPEALPDEDDTTASAAPAASSRRPEPPSPLPAGGPRRPGFGRRTR